jgi:hypothetical protein
LYNERLPTLTEAARSVKTRYGDQAYVGINDADETIRVMFRGKGNRIYDLPLQEQGYSIIYTEGHGDFTPL